MPTEQEVQPSTSAWGQTVEEQVDKRETTPIRDVPILGDTGYYDKKETILDDTHNVPFDPAMIEQQREGARARGNAEGEATPLLENKSMFADVKPLLYDDKPKPPRTSAGAANLAQIETLGSDDPSQFQQRMNNNAAGNGAIDGNDMSIEGTVIGEIKRQYEEGFLLENPQLELLESDNDDEKLDRLSFWVEQLDVKKMSGMSYIATKLLLAGGGQLPSHVAGKYEREHTFAEIQSMRQQDIDEQNKLSRRIIDDFVAQQGWADKASAVWDVAIQEMTPVYNVLSKVGLLREMLSAMDVPSEDQPMFFIGEARQQIRDTLVAMNPKERQKAFRDIVAAVEKLQSNPETEAFLRTFNVLEQFEAIFQEGVLTGDDSSDSFDRFFGNFESAAEGLFSVLAGVRMGSKGFRALFRAGDSLTVGRTARKVGNREQQLKHETYVDGKLAEEMGLAPGEATTVSKLARPEELVDERTIHLPGVEHATARADVLEGEILLAHRGRLSRILSTEDKVMAVRGEMAKLELGDHARMAPAMSTIDDVGDGALIKAVIAKDGTSGWNSVDELIPDLLHLDPQLENVTVMRRGPDGTLVDTGLDAESLARVVTMDLKNMTDAQLISRSADLDKGSIEFLMLEREAAKRAGDTTRSVDEILGDEFFLQHEQFRAWHITDKVAFGADTVRHTRMPDWFLTPNARFGDNLVESFQENYNIQERVTRLFDQMYEPYYTLGLKDKRKVNSMYEWSEEWAKEQGRAPDLIDFHAEFGDLPRAQVEGLVALRRGMDTQFEVFNRRLFLEWKAQDFKTIKSSDPELARYHGKQVDVENAKGGEYFDPVTQEMRVLDDAAIEGIYGDGGTLIKLEVPIDVPGSNGRVKTTVVIADGKDYKVGELSHNPLEYYPGYNYRFYDDPYFITKQTDGITIDGVARAGKESQSDAFRTAGSKLEAERYLSRVANRVVDANGKARWVDKKDPDVVYNFERGRDINQTNRTFREKQSLNTEGRLFWDNRNRDRLLDVNGNQADTMDFTMATERGTALAARQNLEEDVMRAAKNAFDSEFSDLLTKLDNVVVAKTDMGAILKGLTRELNRTSDADEILRLEKAIKLGKYIRQMEGVDSAVIPAMRRLALRAAQWLDAALGGTRVTRKLEGIAGELDPAARMRTVAFGAFMVFRPFRQALLQMSQPLFLSGIDPVYVLSGKGLIDSQALKRGFIKRYDEAFEDGYSEAWAAKRMGLTKKEYRKLTKELDRSGVVDVVDVHSFAGGTRKWNKIALPKEGSIASNAAYRTKQASAAVTGTLKRVGFDFGETYNKLGTFNVAWRRLMKNKKYKSLLEFTDEDWKQVRLDTENLSLAMTRPNNAAYQSGLLSVTTQFLAFTHRVSLTMMFQNPALTTKEVSKMYAGMFLLYGANMFGGRDMVANHLNSMDLGEYAEQEIPGTGGTLIDLLSAGVVQNVVNKVFSTQFDDWQDVELESFSPVLNVQQFYEMNIGNMLKQPGKTIFGPFGNRFSGMLDAFEFSNNLITGFDEMPPADKFMQIADMLAMEVFPQYDDIQMARLGWEMNKLYSETGESTQLQPTFEALLLRGVFGMRTQDELYAMQMNREVGDQDFQVKSMIRANQRFLKQQMFLYNKGEIGRQEFMDASRIVGHLSKHAPSGRITEVLEGSMLDSLDSDDPGAAPVAQLIEAIEGRKLDKGTMISYIKQLVKNPEQQQELIAWVEDLYTDLSQEELRQRMIEVNPAREQ